MTILWSAEEDHEKGFAYGISLGFLCIVFGGGVAVGVVAWNDTPEITPDQYHKMIEEKTPVSVALSRSLLDQNRKLREENAALSEDNNRLKDVSSDFRSK